MLPKSLQTKAEELLCETRRLTEQVLRFKQSAADVAAPLDKLLSSAEVLEMASPRANIHGTLECLLNEDLEPLLRKLAELESLLDCDSQPTDPRHQAKPSLRKTKAARPSSTPATVAASP